MLLLGSGSDLLAPLGGPSDDVLLVDRGEAPILKKLLACTGSVMS